LRNRGISVIEAIADGTQRTGDESLLARATELDRILITSDQDFLEITARWRREGREFSSVAFYTQERFDLGRMLDSLRVIADASEMQDRYNRVYFVPW